MFPVVVNWFYLVAENVKENGRKFWLFSPFALVFFLLFCYFIRIPGGKTKVIGVWVESRFFFFFLFLLGVTRKKIYIIGFTFLFLFLSLTDDFPGILN